jgi:hypothetical protein
MLKQLLRPTNRRIRLVVGLFLAGLFCIQCTRTEAFRESKDIVAIDGTDFGRNAPEIVSKVEELAKTDHIALLQYSLDHYNRNYSDFTCTLAKEEKVHGSVKPEQEIKVKHMVSPFSVAMEWVKNAPLGDRVIYVEGKYDDMMMVRPKGSLLQLLAPYVLRKPDGPEAMRNTLRPVNMFGFGRGLQSLIDVYSQAKREGDLKTAFGGYAEVAGRKCVVLIRYLPAKNDYPAYKTVVYIDVDHLVPMCIEGYDWDEKLQCRYLYKDVEFNVELTSDDFAPEANGIQFAKR